jgi:hypothetical protein
MPTQEMGNRGEREVNIGKTFRTRGRRGERRIDREKGTEAMEMPSNLREGDAANTRPLNKYSPVTGVGGGEIGIFLKNSVPFMLRPIQPGKSPIMEKSAGS